jgi:hypothetical protein
MEPRLKEKIEKIIDVTFAVGKVGLLIVEDEKKLDETRVDVRKILAESKFKECSDYLEIMDALSTGSDKIFYSEKGDRLDGLVLEIIAEFEVGMVSLADRKNNIGLKTVKWNPAKTSPVIMMSRKQTENSYPRLFEYVNITQSI